MQSTMRVYEVRSRNDGRGFDLIYDALPLGRLWYDGPSAIGYAVHDSGSGDAVIRVYDEAGNVIETYEHKDDFKKCKVFTRIASQLSLKRVFGSGTYA